MKTRGILGSALLLISLLALLLACDTSGQSGSTSIGKLTITPPPASIHRQFMTIQFCNDSTSGSGFERTYFQRANALMALSLQNAIRENQDGYVFYTTALTNNTYNEGPLTSLPAVQVPAFPSFAALPTAPPQPDVSNPVTQRATTIAYNATVSAIATDYAMTVQQLQQQIAQEKTAIASQAQALKQWNPAIDPSQPSILGCLQLARARFQRQNGIKILYIASTLESQNDVDGTAEFANSQGFPGVIVHFLYLSSSNAALDHYKRTYWCPYMKHLGAQAIVFDDPGKSDDLAHAKNLFESDAALSTGCPGN